MCSLYDRTSPNRYDHEGNPGRNSACGKQKDSDGRSCKTGTGIWIDDDRKSEESQDDAIYAVSEIMKQDNEMRQFVLDNIFVERVYCP